MRIFLIGLLLLAARVGVGQERALAALKDLDENFPREKVHLFAGSQEYRPGETVWFRCYLFSGYAPSLISTEATVDLVNEKGQRFERVRLPLFQSAGQGSLSLPKDLPEGHYYLHVTTRWIQNFPGQAPYLYPIYLRNSRSSVLFQPKPVRWQAGLFPESGRLLADLPNKLVVRLDAKGSLPGHWWGYVVDAADTSRKLVAFTNENPQLASFVWTPEAGHRYLVRLIDEKGNRAELPVQPQKEGLVLTTVQDRGNLGVEILAKDQLPARMFLLGEMQNGVVLKTELGNQRKSALIPLRSVKPGILHLTLFDESERVLAQRLVFVPPAARAPSALRDLRTVAKDSTFALELDMDTSGLHRYAALVEEGPAVGRNKRTLLSDLWLGDFAPSIDQPSWYFEGGEERYPVLDDLLITEDWPYNWDSLLAGRRPTLRYLPEQYLLFAGTAKRAGQVVRNEQLNFITQFVDRSRHYVQVKTDDKGKFLLGPFVFYDSLNVFSATDAKSKSNVVLHFDAPDSLPSTNLVFPLQTDTLVRSGRAGAQPLADQSQQSAGSMEMVTVKTKTKTPTEQLNEELASDLFETPFNQYLVDLVNGEQDALGYSSLFDWMDGRVPGLQFAIFSEARTGRDGDMIPAGSRVPIMRGNDVALYIDEVPSHYNAMASIPVSDIALVKVIRGEFLGNWHNENLGGAIIIYTRKGKYRKTRAEEPALARLAGYPLVAPFQPSPDSSRSARMIIWQPYLLPETNGRVRLILPSAENRKFRKLVLTGWTKDAEPVYIERILPAEGSK